MRVTKHIYKKIRQEFPDLFIDSQKAQSTSTMFAEFLPATALSSPNVNPWGQYGNSEIPPKRKTVVISFQDIEHFSFSDLSEIDNVARFLKRAGFDVLIPVGDELQSYDAQLFDRKQIVKTGNKSRHEIQVLAIQKKIPADEIFYIDSVKIQLNKTSVRGFC